MGKKGFVFVMEVSLDTVSAGIIENVSIKLGVAGMRQFFSSLRWTTWTHMFYLYAFLSVLKACFKTILKSLRNQNGMGFSTGTCG